MIYLFLLMLGLILLLGVSVLMVLCFTLLFDRKIHPANFDDDAD
jgi:hypothetical protein